MNIIHQLKTLRDLYLMNVKWRKYELGPGFHAGRQVFMYAKHTIRTGRNFYIGRYSEIACDAEIGDNVIFANFVSLAGRYDHHYQLPGVPTRLASQIRDADYEWKGLHEKVVIEDDVWVGYRAVIMSGVRIGCGSIIAAGSVVTKDVEPMSIYAGVPARKVGSRFNQEADSIRHREQLGLGPEHND
ncbi:MAG: acetyltransferase-like isoleucine patch superfamily enzyme [Lentimonas sp.]|jgi:acetyltransferase-like isoleucine patch superfamily enzyme